MSPIPKMDIKIAPEYISSPEDMFRYTSLLILYAACNAYCKVTPICGQKEVCGSYMDVAVDMISKAKYNISTSNKNPLNITYRPNQMQKATDCSDVFQMGQNKSGVYEIWPINRVTEGKSLNVYCDMDTEGGGWTVVHIQMHLPLQVFLCKRVIQRRGDFERSKDYFYQYWKNYKEGFGDIKKDFWLGNDNIFALTNQKLYSARFDLKDVEHHESYALYDKFWIDDESNKYTLHISDYSGDAGDSMISLHNNQKFSTKDQDNDNHRGLNCAVAYKGAWWYNACHQANLNGLYHKGKHNSFADGVNWYAWKGDRESLEGTEIKIRPKTFRH